MTQILLATHNTSKIERYRTRLAVNGIEFTTLKELGLVTQEPEEDGSNEWENAQIKARTYFETASQNGYHLPALSEDTGIYITDLPPDRQPGKDVQRAAGVTQSDTDMERFTKMTDYYIQIANECGGEARAYFINVYCLFDEQTYYKAEGKREIIITNTIHKVDTSFPLCSMYRAVSCGKPYQDLNEAEMNKFLSPCIDRAREMLTQYIKNSNPQM